MARQILKCKTVKWIAGVTFLVISVTISAFADSHGEDLVIVRCTQDQTKCLRANAKQSVGSDWSPGLLGLRNIQVTIEDRKTKKSEMLKADQGYLDSNVDQLVLLVPGRDGLHEKVLELKTFSKRDYKY